jgi:hypothetical protein
MGVFENDEDNIMYCLNNTFYLILYRVLLRFSLLTCY